ncbi:hypothetical protein [Photobacterium damselae]|uniref:hypothetical protein n=1 Tax=Photobacterium damselae TaxID=38293 RepID=UPI0025429E3D
MDNQEIIEELADKAGKKWDEINEDDIWNRDDSRSNFLFILTDVLVNLIVFGFMCLIGFFFYELYSLIFNETK